MSRFSEFQAQSTDMGETMLMHRVNPLWIIFMFFMSYLFNLVGLTQYGAPDFLALTLIFWTVHQPRTVGMTVAFLCGILMDVYSGSVLGQNALAYVVLSFMAFSVQRRLPWFSLIGQALHILPLLLISQIVVMLVRLWLDGVLPDLSWFIQSFTGAILWPIWSFVMSLPESRPSQDSDPL